MFQKGFTLIETLTAVAVLAIVLSLAVPSFAEITAVNRTATQTNEFVSMLALARSEAIKRGGQVTVLPAAANWEAGWRVFFDSDENEVFADDGDATPCESGEDCSVVLHNVALSGGTTLRIASGGAYASYILFDSLGAAQGSSSGSRNFHLCRGDADTAKGKTITLETTGRMRLVQGAASCP